MQRRAEDYSVPRKADGGRAERQKGLSSAAVSAAFPPNFAKNHKKTGLISHILSMEN